MTELSLSDKVHELICEFVRLTGVTPTHVTLPREERDKLLVDISYNQTDPPTFHGLKLTVGSAIRVYVADPVPVKLEYLERGVPMKYEMRLENWA